MKGMKLSFTAISQFSNQRIDESLISKAPKSKKEFNCISEEIGEIGGEQKEKHILSNSDEVFNVVFFCYQCDEMCT